MYAPRSGGVLWRLPYGSTSAARTELGAGGDSERVESDDVTACGADKDGRSVPVGLEVDVCNQVDRQV